MTPAQERPEFAEMSRGPSRHGLASRAGGQRARWAVFGALDEGSDDVFERGASDADATAARR